MTTLLTTRTAIAHYTGGAVTKYQQQAVSDATKRAYANDFRHFTAWCEDQSATSLPAAPPVVAAYLEHLADAGYKTSTISRARGGSGEKPQRIGATNRGPSAVCVAGTS